MEQTSDAPYEAASVDPEVLDDAGAVENLFRVQTLQVDKDGDKGVPNTLGGVSKSGGASGRPPHP